MDVKWVVSVIVVDNQGEWEVFSLAASTPGFDTSPQGNPTAIVYRST